MPKLAVTEGTGKRVPILARVTPTVREGLEVAAGESGRSLSLEIETRLQASFDQDEIKAEMRGTIAALEQRIASMEKADRTLWPDPTARVLGDIFAAALAAVRHAGGRDWRDDPAAPVIMAGVVRRVMERCSRREADSLVSALMDGPRIASTTEAVVASLAGYLDDVMPPLPPLQPQDDPTNWTGRARSAVTFHDKPTGALLDVVTGPEFDLADPEAARDFGPDLEVAISRFRPIRAKVENASWLVFALADGSTAWERQGGPARKIHVPAGQAAPSSMHLIREEDAAAEEPNWPSAPAVMPRTKQPAKPTPDGTRWATPEEIARAVTHDDPMRPASLFAKADFDEAVAGLPIEKAERAAEAKRRERESLDVGTVPVEATGRPRRGRPRKAPAGA